MSVIKAGRFIGMGVIGVAALGHQPRPANITTGGSPVHRFRSTLLLVAMVVVLAAAAYAGAAPWMSP